jgi:hypothetical protein
MKRTYGTGNSVADGGEIFKKVWVKCWVPECNNGKVTIQDADGPVEVNCEECLGEGGHYETEV